MKHVVACCDRPPFGWDEELQVVWVGADGRRFASEFFPDERAASDAAAEIMGERSVSRIWLQGRLRR